MGRLVMKCEGRGVRGAWRAAKFRSPSPLGVAERSYEVSLQPPISRRPIPDVSSVMLPIAPRVPSVSLSGSGVEARVPSVAVSTNTALAPLLSAGPYTGIQWGNSGASGTESLMSSFFLGEAFKKSAKDSGRPEGDGLGTASPPPLWEPRHMALLLLPQRDSLFLS